MIEVDESLTRKVADLARLELTDAEVKTFTPQLGEVLKYVSQLSEVSLRGPDGSEVEPLYNALDFAQTPLRDDQARPSPQDAEGKPKVLGSAPDVLDDGYKVPPIL